MKEKPEERPTSICLPTREDLRLADRLVNEVGGVSLVQFYFVRPEGTPLNSLIPSYSAAVREIIRTVTLKERGSKLEYPLPKHGWNFLERIIFGKDENNQVVFEGKLDECLDAQIVMQLLLPPIHLAYQWHNVVFWQLGEFEELLQKVDSRGFLLLTNADVLLFSDEVEKLRKGRMVTPKYWGGLNSWGCVEDELDNYKVIDGCLYRVWAHLLD